MMLEETELHKSLRSLIYNFLLFPLATYLSVKIYVIVPSCAAGAVLL